MDLLAQYKSDISPVKHNTSKILSPEEVADIEVICVKEKQEVECIDLDDSDSDGISTEKSVSHDTNVATSHPTEAVDYLHLESSDSEDDQSKLHKSVDDLLNSAAILSDINYGPKKPRLDIQVLTANDISPFQTKDFKKDDSPLANISCEVECSNPNKRFKSNEPDNDITIIETPLTELSRNDSCFMFREESRIIDPKNIVNHVPKGIHQTFSGHEKTITSLDWCLQKYGHLFFSSSLDCTLKVWDIASKNAVQCIKFDHPLKAAKWLSSGEQIVAGGYGKRAHIYDILSGREVVSYDMYNIVTSISVHPFMEDVFLCGTHNAILGFDVRVNTPLPIRTFLSKCNEVLDIAFSDENEFICSTNVVSKDSADRTIMVWDFPTGAIMSNQIYLERYTCPSVKVHPQDSSFIAQSNGDYIACFSSIRPYKIKNIRYKGHKVSGYGIECEISPDGKYVATGDANGDIYFYNYRSANLIHKETVKLNVATNRIKWHPILSKTILVSTWEGQLHILK